MEIIVQPKVANDPPQAELDELVASLRHVSDGSPVRVHTEPQIGHGITLEQVIYVWIPWHDIGTALLGAVAGKAVDWLLSLRKRGAPRPRTVLLYGADGKPLRTIEDKGDGAEPVVRAPSEHEPLNLRPR